MEQVKRTFEPARFANDGERLWARYGRSGRGVRVTVLCAAGELAYVEYSHNGRRAWLDVWNDLYRERVEG